MNKRTHFLSCLSRLKTCQIAYRTLILGLKTILHISYFHNTVSKNVPDLLHCRWGYIGSSPNNLPTPTQTKKVVKLQGTQQRFLCKICSTTLHSLTQYVSQWISLITCLLVSLIFLVPRGSSKKKKVYYTNHY